jgi:hypothetical protein
VSEPIRLTVPLPPNLMNQRKHWRAKLRQKRAYWDTLNMLGMDRSFQRPPKAPPAKARITVRLYVHNIMDPDNAMARLKWLLDWLSGSRYIADDAPHALEWAGMPEQEIDRRDPRVEVTIEDVTP